jgi:hypothetical protein
VGTDGQVKFSATNRGACAPLTAGQYNQRQPYARRNQTVLEESMRRVRTYTPLQRYVPERHGRLEDPTTRARQAFYEDPITVRETSEIERQHKSRSEAKSSAAGVCG